jgi:hypothetical protein
VIDLFAEWTEEYQTSAGKQALLAGAVVFDCYYCQMPLQQAKRMNGRPAILVAQHFQGFLPNLRLNATAAQRATLAAIRKHQHGCAGFLRRRSPRFNDRAKDARVFAIKGLSQFTKYVFHGLSLGRVRNGAESIIVAG